MLTLVTTQLLAPRARSTRTRLDMCKNVLEESLKVYSAASAINSAFGSDETQADEGGGGGGD